MIVPIKDFEIINGTTLQEVVFEFLEDGVPLNIDDAKIQVRKKEGGLIAFELSRTVLNNTVTIDKQVVNAEPFNYVYDLFLLLENGDKEVFLKGNFNVLPNITRYE